MKRQILSKTIFSIDLPGKKFNLQATQLIIGK